MKRFAIGLLASLAVATSLVAAQEQAKPAAADQQKNPPDVSVTGCLTQGSGPTVFILDNARMNPRDQNEKAKSYLLVAATEDPRLREPAQPRGERDGYRGSQGAGDAAGRSEADREGSAEADGEVAHAGRRYVHAREPVGTRFSGESLGVAPVCCCSSSSWRTPFNRFFVAQIDEANDAFRVDEVGRRPADDVPVRRDRAVRASRRAPFHHRRNCSPCSPLVFLASRRMLTALDAEDRERPSFVELLQEPLVRILRAADAAPLAGKHEQHDLAAIVAELERHAVEIARRRCRGPSCRW